MQTVQVSGLRELQAALRALPKEMQGPAARRALQTGAKVTKNLARALVPIDTGFLREAIIQFAVKKGEHQYAEQVRVGVRMRVRKRAKLSKSFAGAREKRRGRGASAARIVTPFYWRFVEFGTSRMAARPFMRPAFERSKVEAAGRIKQGLREQLDKAARKLGP